MSPSEVRAVATNPVRVMQMAKGDGVSPAAPARRRE
jgi:hypothetical protein